MISQEPLVTRWILKNVALQHQNLWGGEKGSEERSEQEQTQGMENGMQHALQRDGCSNKCMFIFVRIKWRTSKLKKVAREIFHFCG